MHSWGNDTVDWKGIDEAARYIGEGLKTWGRVSVSQYKEKYGTVRVYCSFGWYGLHEIVHPGYAYVQFRKGGLLWHLNYSRFVMFLVGALSRAITPYQKWLYTFLYGRALRKWPHLRLEILSGADWAELLGKYGVHLVRTGECSYEIHYDWLPPVPWTEVPPRHPDNYVYPEMEAKDDKGEAVVDSVPPT